MTKQKLLETLDEFCCAYRDAVRRHQAGDTQALLSNAMTATYEEAMKVITRSHQDIALGEF